MTGEIYDIPIQGYRKNLPHPHVVVIELDQECWVVPAFGTGGSEVELRVVDFELAGFPANRIFVEIDNAAHVTWNDRRPSKSAKWLVARAKKLSKRQIHRHRLAGKMDKRGLLLIARQLLALADATDIYSGSLKKKLRRLVDSFHGCNDPTGQ